MASTYERGLHEVGDGTWAWLQPDGGWGWSNAGLVVDGDRRCSSTRCSTCRSPRRCSSPCAPPCRPWPDRRVVNTHANGDHCYGNQLVRGAEIVTSAPSAAEMDEVPPAMLAAFVAAAPTWARTATSSTIFGRFDFDGIEPERPHPDLRRPLELAVGDRTVPLVEVGPGPHRRRRRRPRPTPASSSPATSCSTAAPRRVGRTGGQLDRGVRPPAGAGRRDRWCPGHGPVGDRQAVEDQRGYFEWLVAEGTPRLDAGMSPLDAALDLAGGPYEGWGEAERLVANLIVLSRDLGQPDRRRHDPVRRHGRPCGLGARLEAWRRQLEAGELEGGRHRAADECPIAAARRRLPPP